MREVLDPQIVGRPTETDLRWLCRHPKHALIMVEIEGVYVPVIVDELGQEGPIDIRLSKKAIEEYATALQLGSGGDYPRRDISWKTC
jgi:hypothetical protein